MNSKPLTNQKHKRKGKQGKITFVVLCLGAIFACIAPFFHMVFPNESKDMIRLTQEYEKGIIDKVQFDVQYEIAKQEFKLFGFNTPRKFWYAIGRSFTIFYLGIYLMFVFKSIENINLRKSTKVLSFLITGIGLYFIIWAFWNREDFPKEWYYFSMIVISIIGPFIAYWLTNYRFSLKRRIGKLIRFISVEAYYKYIRQEDRDAYIQDSFSVYDDITKP